MTETPENRSRIMRAVKSRDTKPEMVVRKLTHGMGYRYRLHRKGLPGKPDLVFLSRQKIIFVHGCFWHGHHCPRGNRQSKTNAAYWKAKIEKNVDRDRARMNVLSEEGWDVLTIWECETKRKQQEELSQKIRLFLETDEIE